MARYRGFAEVEYEHVRTRVSPTFEWRAFEAPSPRRRPARPLRQARVALVGTAGTHLADQAPFQLGRTGDSSYRELPADADRLRFAHPGYDTRRALADPDVAFPLRLLRRIAANGEIGALAPRAFSFMGYVPDPEPLLAQTGPEVAAKLTADAVDLVLLVPT